MLVAALRIGAVPAGWSRLGFDVDAEGTALVGGVRLELLASAAQGKIVSWALDSAAVPDSVDGLSTDSRPAPDGEGEHPNGALGIDHLVVLTPSLDRTAAALAEIGLDCRRVRDAGDGVRQGFFLFDNLLVEVVEGTGLEDGEPARFWGVTVVVSDL